MSNDIRIKAILEDKVSSGLDKIRDRLDTIGGKGTASTAFGFLGAKAVATGFGFIAGAASEAGTAVVDFVEGSISKASDLNETLQKSSVVFGEASSSIEAFGKKAATSMGLSENAAIGAAASFGNLFVSLGLARDKVAPMSEAMVKLASDLASFNNIGTDEALQKLQSGIVGEARPLRELGVAISEASVDAKAAQLHFKKLNGTFTEGQKVQARYALILDQTKTAQGDFARTSDGLANQQRILTAEMDDLQAKIGQELLPVMVTFAHVLSEDVIPAISDFIDTVKRNAWVFDLLQGGFEGLTHVLNPMGQAVDYNRAAMEKQATAAQDLAAATDETRISNAKAGAAFDALAGHVTDLGDAATDTVKIVSRTPDDIVKALKAGRSDWMTAWKEYQTDFEHPMSTVAEEAKLKGVLASKRLAEGLKSNDPVLRAQANALRTSIVDRLALLENKAFNLGAAAGAALAKGLKKGAGSTAGDINLKLVVESGRGKAKGGPVKAGVPYIVGEDGPELFVPQSNGGIVPNGATIGSGTSVVINYNTVYSSASPAERQRFSRDITAELMRELRRQGVAA